MDFLPLFLSRKSWSCHGHICLMERNTTNITVIVKVGRCRVSHKPGLCVIRACGHLTWAELVDKVLCQPALRGPAPGSCQNHQEWGGPWDADSVRGRHVSLPVTCPVTGPALRSESEQTLYCLSWNSRENLIVERDEWSVLILQQRSPPCRKSVHVKGNACGKGKKNVFFKLKTGLPLCNRERELQEDFSAFHSSFSSVTKWVPKGFSFDFSFWLWTFSC